MHSLNVFIHSTIHPHFHQPIYLLLVIPFIRPSIHRFLYLSIHLPSHRSFHLSIHLPSHRSLHLSIHLPSHRSLHLSIHLPIHRSLHPSLHPPTYSHISQSNHPSIYRSIHPLAIHCPSAHQQVIPWLQQVPSALILKRVPYDRYPACAVPPCLSCPAHTLLLSARRHTTDADLSGTTLVDLCCSHSSRPAMLK
jgi:hypothetical protein